MMILRSMLQCHLLSCLLATGCQFLSTHDQQRRETVPSGKAVSQLVEEVEPSLRKPGLDREASLQRTFVSLDDGSGQQVAHVQAALLSDFPTHALTQTLGNVRIRASVPALVEDWGELFIAVGHKETNYVNKSEIQFEHLAKLHPLDPNREYYYQLVVDGKTYRNKLFHHPELETTSDDRLSEALSLTMNQNKLFNGSIPTASEWYPVLCIRRTIKEGRQEDVYLSLASQIAFKDISLSLNATLNRLQDTIIQPDDELELMTFEQLQEILTSRYGAPETAKRRRVRNR